MSFLLRVFYKFDKEIRLLLGLDFRLRSTDRKVLDQQILPWFVTNEQVKTVLFVGTDVYTTHYARMFGHCNYHTLEPNPKKARFGSAQHTVGVLQDLATYYPSHYFDLIICNGVYGWGLNERQDIEKAFLACHQCLQQGGYFLLGRNELPQYAPVKLDEIEALKQFRREAFGGTDTSIIKVGNGHQHVFELFRKEM